jgi:hypothetical protein
MAGTVPAIYGFVAGTKKTWMPGTGPGMTNDTEHRESGAE